MTVEATIKDVARRARVSPSTISNYFNGRADRMRPETRTRIQQAVDQLGYHPNRAARQLRTGRSHVLGLVVPSVSNPFWGSFAQAFETVAMTNGYQVLLCNAERDAERERRYVAELLKDSASGVVLCSSLLNIDHLRPLMELGLKLVALDRSGQHSDPKGLVSVSVDNVVGARLAGEHLLSLGHRRLGFVSGPLATVTRRERLDGFLQAVSAAGLPSTSVRTWTSDNLSEVDAAGLGRSAAASLLAEADAPTAIFANNDITALGVCQAVRDAGLQVGADVSVVGFDDINLAALVFPALTTVRQPIDDLAQAAFTQLLAQINGNGGVGGSVRLRPELVVRGSTAPPPGPPI